MCSEVFLGMTVIALGESLEETARMVAPARRGHPELAWGNVVGTVIIFLTLNLGLIALIRPLTSDPLVLRLHAPYLIGCTLLVTIALLWAKKLGRAMGALLVALYVLLPGREPALSLTVTDAASHSHDDGQRREHQRVTFYMQCVNFYCLQLGGGKPPPFG